MKVYKGRPIKVYYVKTPDGNIKLFIKRPREKIMEFYMTPKDLLTLYPEVLIPAR